MGLYAFAVPVLPGKAEKNREFTKVIGRSADAKARHLEAGIDRVRVYQQSTPQGEFAIAVWDTDDGARAMQALMSATDDFTTWFRSELTDIHGAELTNPAAAPTPELLAQWSGSGYDPRGEDFAFIVPISSGKVDAYRSMVDEMFHGSQHEEFEQSRSALGVDRQTMFLLETQMGAFALPVLEGPGASRVFAEQLKRDDLPFYSWWRNQLRNVTGRIPTSPPQVEKLLDLMAREPARTKR
jgi:hypothetical protein